VLGKKEEEVVVVEGDLLEIVEGDLLEIVVEVVDLEEIVEVEMTVEMIGEVVEVALASTAIELGTWQEIVLKVTAGRAEVTAEEAVDLEAEVAVVAELATTAIKKGTWLENVLRAIVGIAEADRPKGLFGGNRISKV